MRPVISALLLFFVTSTASAKLSREQLLEMVDAGTDTALIVSLVERDCVDFEVGPEALIDLSGSIPREVLQAAVQCSSMSQTSETLNCQIYRRAAAQPALSDYPFYISPRDHYPKVIYELTSGNWIDERAAMGKGGSLFKGTFKLIKEHTGKHLELEKVIKSVPGFGRFEFRDHPALNTTAKLRNRQNTALLSACSSRARVKLTTVPEGAAVFVDGKPVGRSNLGLELLTGEHELTIELTGHASHRERIVLREGETRTLHVELDMQAVFQLTSEPAGAIVLLNGEVDGKTPTVLILEDGEYDLELIVPGREPYRETLAAMRGESRGIEAVLDEVPADDYCYDLGSSGSGGLVEKSLEALAARWVGSELNLVVPLYRVVTSTMENLLPSTHVVDGKRLLFAPKFGTRYVDQPWKLQGKELKGWAFGETAVSVLMTPAGPVTVTDISRRKSTIVIELRHDNGEENAIYFDFTRDPGKITLDDLERAMCLPFSSYEGFTAVGG